MKFWSKFSRLRQFLVASLKSIVIWLKGNVASFFRLLRPTILHLFLFFLALGIWIIKILTTSGQAIQVGATVVIGWITQQVSNFLGLPKPKLLNLFLFLVGLVTPFYFARVGSWGIRIASPIGTKWIYASLVVIAFISVIIWAEGQKAQSDPIRTVADFVRILADKVEAIAVLLAATLFILEASERKADKQAELWQVIDNAAGIETSHARIKAIESLIRDRVSLEGIDLPNADLSRVNLSNADLSFANLSNADLAGVDLSNADLSSAELKDTDLSDAFFSNTDLSSADLRGSDPSGSDFGNVDLSGTNLSEADFSDADLSWTDFSGANLSGADFSNTKLNNADFSNANLSSAIFLGTDLRLTDIGLLASQLNSENPPLMCNAPLPESVEIDDDKDSDCNEIVTIFYQRYSDEFASLEQAAKYVNTLRQKAWE
ncbi:MAG: pentapeptide repeat-containing protein [Cyanobacteria bacterium P01_D01_bin.156]